MGQEWALSQNPTVCFNLGRHHALASANTGTVLAMASHTKLFKSLC